LVEVVGNSARCKTHARGTPQTRPADRKRAAIVRRREPVNECRVLNAQRDSTWAKSFTDPSDTPSSPMSPVVHLCHLLGAHHERGRVRPVSAFRTGPERRIRYRCPDGRPKNYRTKSSRAPPSLSGVAVRTATVWATLTRRLPDVRTLGAVGFAASQRSDRNEVAASHFVGRADAQETGSKRRVSYRDGIRLTLKP
jgi:hypothetical protein